MNNEQQTIDITKLSDHELSQLYLNTSINAEIQHAMVVELLNEIVTRQQSRAKQTDSSKMILPKLKKITTTEKPSV
jgi:hypothetical protein